MQDKIFEAALGIQSPWSVTATDFNARAKRLTIRIDFAPGTRFAAAGVEGLHPVHDTVLKRYRHLNFFQHECVLEVRTPRVELPGGGVRLIEPGFAGKLSGFTLLFEALVLLLARQMPFAAVARIVGASAYRVQAICERYVEEAVGEADLSEVTALAIDETSRARGHDYITIAADAEQRRVIFVTEGREARAIEALTEELATHGCPPERIESVTIDMSPAFIKGCNEHLPGAQITFDKFHVVWHANAAVDQTRRIEQRTDPELKGMRWTLLKDSDHLKLEDAAQLYELVRGPRLRRTARAWVYKELLRQALERRQINVMREALAHWCTCVMRSKVEPMKEVAALVRRHLEGIVAWARSRQTNGFLEAINGLFQAAKRRARGFTRLATIKTVIFLIAGRLDFSRINPHAH